MTDNVDKLRAELAKREHNEIVVHAREYSDKWFVKSIVFYAIACTLNVFAIGTDWVLLDWIGYPLGIIASVIVILGVFFKFKSMEELDSEEEVL